VVLVHGPGGIGKSALLRQVADRGRAAGWTPVLVEGRDLPPVPDAIEDALADAHQFERPLILIDTYERMGTRAERSPARRARALGRRLAARAESERLMRRVLERGYLDPAASHEQAADELNLSRAAYFRRLKLASERLAEVLSS
jgi:TPP-dependent pyruvate/acetoin dehydrogenase alpha subunit